MTYRTLALSDDAEVPELDELAQHIEAGWDAWFTSPNKYSDVLPTLPSLIITAERAVYESGGSPEACRLACEVYQLARPVLKHLGRVDLGGLVADRCMRYAEETEDPLVIAAATWNLGQALYADDKPAAALDVATRGAEKLQRLLADATPAHFAAYGGLQQVAAIAAVRLEDPWRARELLRGPAWEAATRVGEGRDDHHIFFGPTNVRIHMVHVEQQVREIPEALRLADDVDITKIASLERKTTHLYEIARCYDYRNNDAAVFVHLKMAEKLCPEDFRRKKMVREMVATLLRRAKSSYASEVREFASRIGLMN